EQHTPVLVNLKAVRMVGAGFLHTCAVQSSDVLYCWGSNSYNELGLSPGDRHGPVQVFSSYRTYGSAPSAFSTFTCHLRRASFISCSGRNEYGQIGDGTGDVTPTSRDVLITPSEVVEVATGFAHACARMNSGAVLCWGLNANGQIGDGTQLLRFVPTPVVL